MTKVMTIAFFILLILGACGVMNEQGNIQPLGVIMTIVGMLGLLFISNFYYTDWSE